MSARPVTAAAAVVLALSGCSDDEQPARTARTDTTAQRAPAAEGPRAQRGRRELVSCLERAGLGSVRAAPGRVFPHVRFEVAATRPGRVELLAYGYASPGEARANGAKIRFDTQRYPRRAYEGRVLAFYGAGLTDAVRRRAADCLRRA